MDGNQSELLSLHKQLDFDCRHRNGRPFVSDWYCEHPFVDDIIPVNERLIPPSVRLEPYNFPNDTTDLHAEIGQFHRERGEGSVGADQIFITAGLSPLITAQMIMLKRRGVRRVNYIKPLYYTYYFLANTLGIELIPVNDAPLISPDAKLDLDRLTEPVLIFCDPIWFMGRNLAVAIIEQIRAWQSAEDRLVLVDGAFQYLRWKNNNQLELSSLLDPERTLRNICPTKSTATHGIRFAYSIVPKTLLEEVRYCYSNVAGSASAFDMHAARSMMKWLNSSRSNGALLDFIDRRYKFMTERGLLSKEVEPNAAYFCFVKFPLNPQNVITMSQEFFDTTTFPDFGRFNLLLPSKEMSAFIHLCAAELGGDYDALMGGLSLI